MAKVDYQVLGMTCQNCVRHVTRTLTRYAESISQEAKVEVSLEDNKATVDWPGTIPEFDAIKSLLQEEGYESSPLGESKPPA